jgi:hypothetical protein
VRWRHRVTETILATLFLIVSVESVVVQARSLWRLLSWNYDDTSDHRRIHDGMLRTAICRVIAAAIYVCVGVVTLIAQQALPVLALVVFSFVQLMWQGNAFADVRLRRDLTDGDSTRERDDAG